MNDKKLQYSKKLTTGEEVKFKFYFNSPKTNEITFYLGFIALAKMQLHFLQNILITYLKEIISNAVKANVKRIFFSKNNVDIHDQDKCREMTVRFKKEVLFKMDQYFIELKKESLIVVISMQLMEKEFLIKVTNNSPILPEELIKIKKRISNASKATSIEDTFDEVLDDIEATGLGLVLNAMLLNKSGIGADAFSIHSDNKNTQAILKIPQQINRPDNIQKIQEMIMKEVEGIPTFPENVNKIIRMCDDPKSEITVISQTIQKDPALAAEIVKLAGSAGYFSNLKTISLSSAVTKLGLKVIREMALAISARKILNDHYKIFQGFWKHSFKCAFYSKKIAEKIGLKSYTESLYLGGLLHDIGKIILFAVKPEIIEKINGLRVNRNGFSSSVIEEISLGISHTEIGGKISKNWNFSPNLIQIILFHHYPFAAEEDYLKEVSIVHIADSLVNRESKKGEYFYVDHEALRELNIHSENEFERLHNEIQTAFLEIEERL